MVLYFDSQNFRDLPCLSGPLLAAQSSSGWVISEVLHCIHMKSHLVRALSRSFHWAHPESPLRRSHHDRQCSTHLVSSVYVIRSISPNRVIDTSWKLDNVVASARFLTSKDRLKAVERLRANEQVIDTDGHHVLECALEIKTWAFVGMTLLLNIGACVSSSFGG